ncbi:MAG: ATP-binding cassette domain-containing protein [Planctomycetales bacterium]|nr:ATP-binding cassette domain-containing protein [bacterium]UNM07741.1 MAG: ATP-binding cassette domain-containing protein [Planctomycetales bacterium]
MSNAPQPLLKVEGLSKYFPIRAGSFGSGGQTIRAVHNVSFSIGRRQTLGLVGESGCGKSTTARLVLRLIEPSEGSILLDGEELMEFRPARLKQARRRMQIVFQDPMGSLNPRRTVGQSIAEPLEVNGWKRSDIVIRIAELLKDVELPASYAERYPHEFSGGQRQRIAIARALALKPDLVIADEPVSALDASIQSQILNLLERLKEEHDLAYLFISHDLSVVRHICDKVAVMYLGEIVEEGDTAEVYGKPAHPYTQALLKAIPVPGSNPQPVEPLEGSLPSAIDPPKGCAFASRCPHVMPRCSTDSPPSYKISEQHSSRCWLNETGQRPS